MDVDRPEAVIDPAALADNPAGRLCDQLVSAIPPEQRDLREQISAVKATLDQPLRVALTGRVSAGKSTLLNALVGRRIAATAAEECTRYPMVFRYGAPEAAVGITRDGRRLPLSIAALLGQAPFTPGEPIVFAEVTLQSDVLGHLTLIDTPGLAATAPHRQVADATIDLAAGAEVVLHLFRGAARSDDTAVLDEMRESSGGPDRGAATTIGLLSHADNFGSGGWGEDDAIGLARESARRVATSLPNHFTTVLAVSGLMAETARTGRVTEADARTLRALAGLPREAVQFARGVDADVHGRLSALLTPYGLNHGRQRASTSSSLGEWLLEASGVRALEDALRGAAVRARHVRTARALDDLVQVARQEPRLPDLGRCVEAFAHSPWGHVTKEVRAERVLSHERPHSPWVQDLRNLLSYPTPEHRLGVVPPGADLRQWATDQAGRYQAESGVARGGAEREAVRTLAQSMLHLARTGPPS